MSKFWYEQAAVREYEQRKHAFLASVQAKQIMQKVLQNPDPNQFMTILLHHFQWAVEGAYTTALLLELDIFLLELDAFVFSLSRLS